MILKKVTLVSDMTRVNLIIVLLYYPYDYACPKISPTLI